MIKNVLTPLVLYRVVYKQANSSEYAKSELIAGNNYTISNLQFDALYDISVMAVSVVGESERLLIKQVKTLSTKNSKCAVIIILLMNIKIIIIVVHNDVYYQGCDNNYFVHTIACSIIHTVEKSVYI